VFFANALLSKRADRRHETVMLYEDIHSCL